MIKNMTSYFHFMSDFIYEIKNISISQWDVESKNDEVTNETVDI
tara:strand:- start:162 stop:293 length:132 start_codon:yes stop_codon:yes gene_type:complete